MNHEKALVGAILDKPDILVDIIGIVNTSDFLDMNAGIAFNNLCEMWRSEEAIDLMTLIPRLGEGFNVSWLVECTGVFSNRGIAMGYAEIIREKSTTTRIKNKLHGVIEESVDSDHMLESIANLYDSEGGKKTKESDIGSAMESFELSIEYAKKNGFGVDTGFGLFDRLAIKYSPSHIWVIGGFTSVGKTALLTEMISRLDLSTHSAAVISTEMTTDQNIGRILANKTGFSSSVIMSGGLYERNVPKLNKHKERLKACNLHIFDDLYELSEIELALIKLNMQSGVDVVFLDYLQNCTVSGSTSEYQEMSMLAKRLQKLAKKIKATIVCLSQVSNSAAKDDSGILQFKGAGEFSAVADVGIVLQKNKTEKTQVLVDVRKHRHGPKGRNVVQYTEGWTRLEEVEHTDNE